MGMLLKRCPNCSTLDYFLDGDCSKCGYAPSPTELSKMETAAKSSIKENDNKEANWDALRTTEKKAGDGANSNIAVQQCMSNAIDDPQTWMYIAAFFIPVLQYILVGVYVSKNDMSNAFKLLVIPLLVQVLLVIALILYYYSK